MRETIFLLVADHALKVQDLIRHLLFASVSVQSGRVSHGDFVLARAAEDQELIRVCHAAPGRILAACPMRQAFHHGAVADGQRLFPDEITVRELPPVGFVKPDDFTGEINQGIAPAVSGRDVHAMHGGHASRLREPMNFLHGKLVVPEKLISGNAVAHVSLVAAVLVETSERRRVNG